MLTQHAMALAISDHPNTTPSYDEIGPKLRCQPGISAKSLRPQF